MVLTIRELQKIYGVLQLYGYRISHGAGSELSRPGNESHEHRQRHYSAPSVVRIAIILSCALALLKTPWPFPLTTFLRCHVLTTITTNQRGMAGHKHGGKGAPSASRRIKRASRISKVNSWGTSPPLSALLGSHIALHHSTVCIFGNRGIHQKPAHRVWEVSGVVFWVLSLVSHFLSSLPFLWSSTRFPEWSGGTARSGVDRRRSELRGDYAAVAQRRLQAI